MFTKLTWALALLFSASMSAAAKSSYSPEPRTGVPYYMAPFISASGGGVAPSIGLGCLSAVRLTPEVDRGVPITFWSPHSDGESVVIDESTDVFISFNASDFGDRKTWGNRFYTPAPSTIPLVLVGKAAPLIYSPTRFKIKKERTFYSVYSPQLGEGYEGDYSLVYDFEEKNECNVLALSNELPPLFFSFYEPDDYHRKIKSVV